MGREDLTDDDRFDTNEKRKDRMDEIDEIVEEWTKRHERDELADALLEAGVPVGPVKERDEVLFDPHLEERGMINEIEHPEYGTIRVPGLPMKLHGSEEPEIRPAHEEGQANEEVYGKLGLTKAEIRELREEGVI